MSAENANFLPVNETQRLVDVIQTLAVGGRVLEGSYFRSNRVTAVLNGTPECIQGLSVLCADPNDQSVKSLAVEAEYQEVITGQGNNAPGSAVTRCAALGEVSIRLAAGNQLSNWYYDGTRAQIATYSMDPRSMGTEDDSSSHDLPPDIAEEVLSEFAGWFGNSGGFNVPSDAAACYAIPGVKTTKDIIAAVMSLKFLKFGASLVDQSLKATYDFREDPTAYEGRRDYSVVVSHSTIKAFADGPVINFGRQRNISRVAITSSLKLSEGGQLLQTVDLEIDSNAENPYLAIKREWRTSGSEPASNQDLRNRIISDDGFGNKFKELAASPVPTVSGVLEFLENRCRSLGT